MSGVTAGMRNLAVVSLSRAGVTCLEVGRLFGIRPERVSRLRRQVSEGGSREFAAAHTHTALFPSLAHDRQHYGNLKCNAGTARRLR
jgi:hypothetical protein